MFNNCFSLTSLDIAHFNITSGTFFERIIYGCNKSLTYCFKEENMKEILKNELYYYDYENNCMKICIIKSKKFINETKECVENCQSGDYKYEYNNICYNSCPRGSHKSSEDSYFCEEGFEFDNYYSSDKTDFYDKIPSGYYENDTEQKTVVECSFECSECNLLSTINNLCIKCNISNGYYPKYNDSNNIDEYIKCYNTEQIGYFLDNFENIYKPCYSICQK